MNLGNLMYTPRQQCVGRVVGKEFTPAHIEVLPLTNDDGMLGVCIPSYHTICCPDVWLLKVEVEGRCKKIAVTQDLYNSLCYGEPAVIEYTKFLGFLHIKSVSQRG